jgi:hypothetical protein
MPLFKWTAFYHDDVSLYDWSISNTDIWANQAAFLADFNPWNTKYMACCPPHIHAINLQYQDLAGGMPLVVLGPGVITNTVGTAPVGGTYPTADGWLWKGYGGPVNKGRSDYLFHGISSDYSADSNFWDPANAQLLALALENFHFLKQFRPVASPVRGYPIVAPPEIFTSYLIDPYIRLRRVGRPFHRGGQGLRSR